MLGTSDIILLIFFVVAAIGVGLYFFSRWAYRRMGDQQSMIDKTKTTVSIYVIDKKKDKLTNANFPKAVTDQIPKYSRLLKMPLVKAKIGPTIATLICDKQVFDVIPLKKNVKVELAGIYISGMKGMKTKQELKQIAKAKKQKEREEKGSPLNKFKSMFKK